MRTSRFCDWCEVALDLHPSGEQTDDQFECDAAEARANVIGQFWSVHP